MGEGGTNVRYGSSWASKIAGLFRAPMDGGRADRIRGAPCVRQLSVASALDGHRKGRCRLDGQRELKGRTPSCVGARPQMPAMSLDDPSTNGPSHPAASRFRGEECLENALGFIDRKPDARITHRNQ